LSLSLPSITFSKFHEISNPIPGLDDWNGTLGDGMEGKGRKLEFVKSRASVRIA
jgi:hypothetical protein